MEIPILPGEEWLKKILRVVITGNPGVGKHTTAKIVAEKLDAEIVDINAVAIDGAAIVAKTGYGLDVDVKKLGRLLSARLKKANRRNVVIVGHLAPYVLRPGGIGLVAVLRRSPYELEKTLEARGYTKLKVRENVASEILGVTLFDAIKKFGRRKLAELDTTGRNPGQTADSIISALRKRPKAANVDWLGIVSDRGDMKRFFAY